MTQVTFTVDTETTDGIIQDAMFDMYHDLASQLATGGGHPEDIAYNRKLLKAARRVHNYFCLPTDRIKE